MCSTRFPTVRSVLPTATRSALPRTSLTNRARVSAIADARQVRRVHQDAGHRKRSPSRSDRVSFDAHATLSLPERNALTERMRAQYGTPRQIEPPSMAQPDHDHPTHGTSRRRDDSAAGPPLPLGSAPAPATVAKPDLPQASPQPPPKPRQPRSEPKQQSNTEGASAQIQSDDSADIELDRRKLWGSAEVQ